MSEKSYAALIESLADLPSGAVQSWLHQHQGELSREFVEVGKARVEEVGYSGDLAGAQQLLQRLHIVARWLGDPLAIALVERGDANVLQFHERYAESLAASQRAVAIYEAYGTSFDVAVARTVEVATLSALERFDEAIELAHWIRPHFVEAQFLFGQARLAHALAHVYASYWQLENAWREYEIALKLFETLERPLDVAWLQINMGNLANKMDQLDLAEACYHRAYPILVQHDDTVVLIKFHFNLAHTYIRQARFDDALAQLTQGRKLLVHVPNTADQGYIDLAEAQIRQHLNQRAQAEQLLERAVEYFATLGRQVEAVEALMALGYLLGAEAIPERLAQGLAYMKQAEVHLQALDAPLLSAWVLLEEAELLLRLQRTEDAYRQAAAVELIFAQAGLKLRQLQSQVLMADCCSHWSSERAYQLYKNVLDNMDESTSLLAARSWQGLGKLAIARGASGDAERAYVNAINILDTLRRGLRSHAHQAGFAESRQALDEALLAAFHAQDDCTERVLNWLERMKAGALAELLANQPPDVSVSERLRSLLLERDRVAERLDRQISVRHQGQGYSATAAQRGAALVAQDRHNQQVQLTLQRQLQILDEQIVRQQHPANAWRDGVAISANEVQALLDEETVLISYYAVEGNLYALTATSAADDLQIHPLNISLSEIKKKWLYTRRLITRPNNQLVAAKQRLAYLWQKLIAPLEVHLQQKRRLLIMPHKGLYYIPFAGLYDAVNKRYLTQRWVVQTAPSATILTWCRQRPTSTQSILLVGYPGEPSDPLYLPHVRQELDTLAGLVSDADLLWAEAATVEKVITHMSDRALIHLAGHAFFDSNEPLASGMPLADGRWLRAADLYLRYGSLEGATVILSGCNTARGQARGGDVLGLTSAFLYAGATGVVAGLWWIDDAATRQFMTDFYWGLNNSIDVAEALQHAQLQMLADDIYCAPYYWAPFVLSGNSYRFNFDR